MSTSSGQNDKPLKPSEATKPSLFDRFATAVNATVARAWFFAACVALIVVWAPTYFLVDNVDTWQLLINTPTTCITFLLVGLAVNTQSRDSKALHRKLNALVEAQIDIMEAHQESDSTMRDDIEELRQAVGLEHREGS